MRLWQSKIRPDRRAPTPSVERIGPVGRLAHFVAVGPGVTEFTVGDSVVVTTAMSMDLTGAYAEKVKRPV